MGVSAAKAICDCNGTGNGGQSQKSESSFCSKSVLSTCKPALKAVVRSKCGYRRMFICIFIILIVMGALYCWTCPQATAFRLCLQNQFRSRTVQPPRDIQPAPVEEEESFPETEEEDQETEEQVQETEE
ncbi:uncharacterized protein LOC143213115 [Lasioglossum baleicum]|uniref:uncharacterized protein LOC143213115 n=1 Tax=Lasioglossum baleicum TaxID=434251 RepID=UPI003FCC807C